MQFAFHSERQYYLFIVDTVKADVLDYCVTKFYCNKVYFIVIIVVS